MDDKMQNRIDVYFEKLTKFINNLPISGKGKEYIWFDTWITFYDDYLPDENNNFCEGIKTEWQLQKALQNFKKKFQKLRIKAVEKYSDDLNKIEPSEAVAKIDSLLYKLRKNELLAEIGADALNDWENWLKKYLSNEIEHQQKRPIRKLPKQQKKTSYLWVNNPDEEIKELYNLMIGKYKLIAPETTYEQFKAIFTGQPIESINPIKWHQENASELLYFIDKLAQSNNIEHNPKKANYQRMTACFVKPDGNPFQAAWKSLKTDIELKLSPDKQRAIDELINNFY